MISRALLHVMRACFDICVGSVSLPSPLKCIGIWIGQKEPEMEWFQSAQQSGEKRCVHYTIMHNEASYYHREEGSLWGMLHMMSNS